MSKQLTTKQPTMIFLKNLLKIIVISVFVIASAALIIPCEWVILNVAPFIVPIYFILGTYCYTYKISPDELLKRFMNY